MDANSTRRPTHPAGKRWSRPWHMCLIDVYEGFVLFFQSVPDVCTRNNFFFVFPNKWYHVNDDASSLDVLRELLIQSWCWKGRSYNIITTVPVYSLPFSVENMSSLVNESNIIVHMQAAWGLSLVSLQFVLQVIWIRLKDFEMWLNWRRCCRNCLLCHPHEKVLTLLLTFTAFSFGWFVYRLTADLFTPIHHQL